MVLLALVNMFLLLIGFLPGLRKRNEATITDARQNELRFRQLPDSQKG